MEQQQQQGKIKVDATVEKTEDMSVVELVVQSKLAKSKNEARRLIDAGGLYINGNKVKDKYEKIQQQQHEILILRAGKKRNLVVALA